MIEKSKDTETNTNKMKIHTLGRFEVYNKNGILINAFNRSNILWKLFKFLIVNKDKDLPPEIILENIYPHDTFDNPKNNVQNLIYRLRKLLADQDVVDKDCQLIIYSNGCYRLDLRNHLVLDINAFEHHIDKAKHTKGEEAVSHYLKAIEMYKGNFLPELIYEDWIINERTYYERLYIQAVLQLCDVYEKQDLFDKVIPLCEKVMLVEPYEEDLHIYYMKALLKINKPREAQKHYEQTTNFFYKQFGVKPSPDMQKLYKIIKSDPNPNSEQKQSKISPIWDNNKGAFFCDHHVFHSIYVLEKRRSERNGKKVNAVGLRIISKEDHEDIHGLFRKAITLSLRKGDVLTVTDDQQFLILLPELNFEQVKHVMDRIIEKFKSENQLLKLDFQIESIPSLDQTNNQ